MAAFSRFISPSCRNSGPIRSVSIFDRILRYLRCWIEKLDTMILSADNNVTDLYQPEKEMVCLEFEGVQKSTDGYSRGPGSDMQHTNMHMDISIDQEQTSYPLEIFTYLLLVIAQYADTPFLHNISPQSCQHSTTRKKNKKGVWSK